MEYDSFLQQYTINTTLPYVSVFILNVEHEVLKEGQKYRRVGF